jgi:type I restriction enzyme S subunit
MAALADIADLIMGQSPPSSTYNEAGDGLAFFQGKTDFGFRHPTPRLFCSAPLKIAKPDDILMSVRAPVGPTNIADRECCIGRGLAAIRPRKIDGDFLFFNLRYIEKSIASLGSGSTFHAINKSQLASLEVNPHEFSLPEQRKIAGVLGVVQRAMEQQERLLALTAELKKALLHQLFTAGLHGEPQKQTDIGPVPRSWELVKLDDVFETQLGKMLSQKAHIGNDPKPYLRNKNIQWGQIDITDLLEMNFNERERAKFILRPGDLLICEGGEPGRAAIWRGELKECYYQKALHRLHPKDQRVTNEYLSHWLAFSFQLQNLYGVAGASSTIAHLPESQLKALPIPMPKRSEQDEICVMLEGVVRNVAHHRRKHAALTALFQTLLHQLMTAQIRVHDLDLEELFAQAVAEKDSKS